MRDAQRERDLDDMLPNLDVSRSAREEGGRVVVSLRTSDFDLLVIEARASMQVP